MKLSDSLYEWQVYHDSVCKQPKSCKFKGNCRRGPECATMLLEMASYMLETPITPKMVERLLQTTNSKTLVYYRMLVYIPRLIGGGPLECARCEDEVDEGEDVPTPPQPRFADMIAKYSQDRLRWKAKAMLVDINNEFGVIQFVQDKIMEKVDEQHAELCACKPETRMAVAIASLAETFPRDAAYYQNPVWALENWGSVADFLGVAQSTVKLYLKKLEE